MSDIQQELAALAQSRLTPTVLGALDYIVPGEWENVTTLEDVIRVNLGITEPTQVAAIKERARALWQAKPHYQRALTIYRAVDTADRAVAAAVAANAVGNTFSFFGFLGKVTPKPDTAQALDAALKLAAEVAAFATLRGLPTNSLAEAAAFPAALGTYAKADMMRLAAWVAIDGILPLGPQFVSKIVGIVQGIDTAALTANPLFSAMKGYIPGGDVNAQKGFLVSTMNSGASYVNEFVAARGLTQSGIAGTLGTLVSAADKSMDALAAALDATTDYYSHTGLQSVARVLVHDAQESLASGEVVAAATDVAPTAEGSSWFRNAAIGTGVVAAVGAAGVAAAGVAGAAALWNAWSSDDDDDEKDTSYDPKTDTELVNLDDNALAAREQAIEAQARQMIAQAGTAPPTPQLQEQMMKLRMMRRRLRRQRRMRMRMAMQAGRPGLGRGGGMGGGRGGRGGGGMGRGRF